MGRRRQVEFPITIENQEQFDELMEGRLQRARQQWERESGLADAERQRDEARNRATKAERDAHARIVRREARDVLAGMGVKDRKRQDLVMKLADLAGVEADKDGEPNRKQIADAFKALHADTPDVFGPDAQVTDSAPDGGGPGGGTDAEPLSLEKIQRMSPDEINSVWDRVSAFLSGER